MLHGRTPPAPIISNPNPLNKIVSWPDVASAHLLLPFWQEGGCRLGINAVSVSTSIPCNSCIPEAKDQTNMLGIRLLYSSFYIIQEDKDYITSVSHKEKHQPGNIKLFMLHYQEIAYRSEGESLVSTKISIGQECSDQGSQIAGTTEDIEEIGCSNALHVEDSGQIHQQICSDSKSSQLIKHFIPCQNFTFNFSQRL